MTALDLIISNEPWRRRLYLPNYGIAEASRYAGVSAKTISDWHRIGGRKAVTLSHKEKGIALSYMQLIEVAVVAAFRKEQIPLQRIRDAREYVSSKLKSEYPFAEYKFKTDGKRLWIAYEQIEGERKRGTLLGADQQGQLAWEAIIGRLKEFDYEDGGIAVRWHLDGPKSPVVIDPRVAFGAPNIDGIPTWVLKGRRAAGETVDDIADDFGLKKLDVRKALEFEGIKPGRGSKASWVN